MNGWVYCHACFTLKGEAQKARRRSRIGYTPNTKIPPFSFYIVADEAQGIIKFGISGDLEARLSTHARGSKKRPFKLTTVIAVSIFQNTTDEVAAKAEEDKVKLELKKLGINPVVGTEYFDLFYAEEVIQACRRAGVQWVPGFELQAGGS